MKCYAIAIKRDNAAEIEITTPALFSSKVSFFKASEQAIITKMLKKHQEDINQLMEEMEEDTPYILNETAYFIHAQQYNKSYCAIITDEKLNPSQLLWLTYHLLNEQLPPEVVIKELETYTKDIKTEKIKKELDNTKELLADTIDSLNIRNEKLEDLVIKTEKLEFFSLQFRKSTNKLNSCWPACTLL